MKIVYFDGYCNLCNGFVDFLVRHDHTLQLHYASLQGATAAARLPYNLRDDLATMVFETEGKTFTESAAAVRALAQLGGIYAALLLFLLVPSFMRDAVYRLIARNRYRLAGRRSTCRLPSAEERERFLD